MTELKLTGSVLLAGVWVISAIIAWYISARARRSYGSVAPPQPSQAQREIEELERLVRL